MPSEKRSQLKYFFMLNKPSTYTLHALVASNYAKKLKYVIQFHFADLKKNHFSKVWCSILEN